MRKYLFLIILGITSFLMVNAQKESGMVYSNHEGIAKARAMWAAFVKGDKEACLSFFADSLWHVKNGVAKRVSKNTMESGINYWKGVDNFAIKDDKPATPDAIQYQEGGLWVQDWLRLTGIHNKSGYNLDWPIHNLYRFNKEGKIDVLTQYYDPKPFEEMNNGLRTTENGAVYNNHPYIVTTRKCANAFCAEDIETLTSFYSPKAVFWSSTGKVNDFFTLEQKMKQNRETFANCDNLKLAQVGTPDCIYYAKEDYYTVYSWWSLSFTTKDGKVKSEIPVMMTNDFNKEGKITRELIYISGTHLQ